MLCGIGFGVNKEFMSFRNVFKLFIILIVISSTTCFNSVYFYMNFVLSLIMKFIFFFRIFFCICSEVYHTSSLSQSVPLTFAKALDSQLQCAAPLTTCGHSRYRTLDGSCNNLANPLWGVANRRYSRLLSAKYGDGFSTPTLSITGHDMPNSRLVSLVAFGEQDIPDPQFTLATMQWGQIVTHDMSMLAGSTQSSELLIISEARTEFSFILCLFVL